MGRGVLEGGRIWGEGGARRGALRCPGPDIAAPPPGAPGALGLPSYLCPRFSSVKMTIPLSTWTELGTAISFPAV